MEHTNAPAAPATERADRITVGTEVTWKGQVWTVVRNAVTTSSAGFNMLYLDRPERDSFKPVLLRWSDRVELA